MSMLPAKLTICVLSESGRSAVKKRNKVGDITPLWCKPKLIFCVEDFELLISTNNCKVVNYWIWKYGICGQGNLTFNL